MYRFGSVTELNSYTQDLLSYDEKLSNLAVTGEISGLKIYSTSGHCYFTLKDAQSQISCVMFASYLGKLNFIPKDGMKVVLAGAASIYQASGKYQIKVFNMRREGQGELYEQYKELYLKLNQEGLFAPEHKRRIPLLPKRIGVVTSPMGAVIHDIITTLRSRNPYFDILIYPSAVQGENCAKEVSEGIRYLSENDLVDVMIVARGGGSFEEIFGYSDERVVRAVYESKVPVITAIGHEVHSPLCDFASDMRAATPTQAAEFVMAEYDVLCNELSGLRSMMEISFKAYMDNQVRRIDHLKNHKALMSPRFYVDSQIAYISEIKNRLTINGINYTNKHKNDLALLTHDMKTAYEESFDSRKREIASFIDKLDLLGPVNVLKRGYSYVSINDKALTSVKEIEKGNTVNIVFADGEASAVIESIKESN